MTGPAKPYRVLDRRTFDKEGQRREVLNPHLKPIESKTIQCPLDRAFRCALDRLERISPPPMWPRTLRRPDIARGFLLSSNQLHRSVVRLLMASQKSGEEYLLSTAILGRSLVENIGNFFCFLDHPVLFPRRLSHDDFKYSARICRKNVEFKFGTEKDRKDEAATLGVAARLLGLTPDQVAKPETLQEIPTPGVLSGSARRRDTELSLLGTRKLAFRELEAFWYTNLSAFSHQRMRALQLATGCWQSDDAAEMEALRSSAIALAFLCLLCCLSELDADLNQGRICSPDLQFLWESLKDVNVLYRRVHSLRYEDLLRIGGIPG